MTAELSPDDERDARAIAAIWLEIGGNEDGFRYLWVDAQWTRPPQPNQREAQIAITNLLAAAGVPGKRISRDVWLRVCEILSH